MQPKAKATILVGRATFELIGVNGSGFADPLRQSKAGQQSAQRHYVLDERGLRLTRLIAYNAPYQFRYEYLDVRYAFDGTLLVARGHIEDERTRMLPLGRLSAPSPLEYAHVEELCCERGKLVARSNLSPVIRRLREKGLSLHEELRVDLRRWLDFTFEQRRAHVERERALIVEAWSELDARALRHVSSFYVSASSN